MSHLARDGLETLGINPVGCRLQPSGAVRASPEGPQPQSSSVETPVQRGSTDPKRSCHFGRITAVRFADGSELDLPVAAVGARAGLQLRRSDLEGRTDCMRRDHTVIGEQRAPRHRPPELPHVARPFSSSQQRQRVRLERQPFSIREVVRQQGHVLTAISETW